MCIYPLFPFILQIPLWILCPSSSIMLSRPLFCTRSHYAAQDDFKLLLLLLLLLLSLLGASVPNLSLDIRLYKINYTIFKCVCLCERVGVCVSVQSGQMSQIPRSWSYSGCSLSFGCWESNQRHL